MLCDGKPLNVGAFASRHLRLGAYETRAIVFSKMKGNLIKSALFPLFCLCQPKRSPFWVQQGALSAHHFLIADFYELVHSLHSPSVKPIYLRTIAET
jgi:hypothetical protein